MPIARTYEYYEVRDMLKKAEQTNSPVTNERGHGRGLHAMSPGWLDRAHQLDRVTKRPNESNNQFKKRGAGRTGAFMNQIQQGSAACEALNSPTGQAVLAVFDDPAHAGKRIRVVITVTGIKESGFLPGTLAPHATLVKKGDAAVQTLVTNGVLLILDRGPNGTSAHIQTCYPSSDAVASSWSAIDFATKAVLASG